MNKWLGLSLVVVIAAVGSVFAFTLIYQAKPVDQLESIIPADAIYYLYTHNLNKNVDDFHKSPFYQKLSQLSLYQKYLVPELEKIKEETSLLQDVFSSDSALAIFSSPASLPKPGDLNIGLNMSSNLLVLAKLDDKNIGKTVNNIYKQLSKDKIRSVEKYKGIKITAYTKPAEGNKPEQVTNLIRLGNVIAYSNDSKIIKESIDLYKGLSQDSLLSDSTFGKVTAKYSQSKKEILLWIYVNHQQYYKDMLSAFAKESLDQGDLSIGGGIQFGKFRDFIKSFADVSVGMVASLDYAESGDGLVWEGYQLFDRSKDKFNILDVFISSGSRADIVNVTPADIIACLGISGNPSSYWNYFKQILSIFEDIAPDQKSLAFSPMPFFSPLAALEFAESFLGVSFEKDILPLLGSNTAAVLSGLEDVTLDFSQNQGSEQGEGPPIGFSKIPIILPDFSIILQAKDSLRANQLKDIVIERIVPKVNSFIKDKMIAAEKAKAKEDQDITGESEPIEDIFQVSSQDYAGCDVDVISIKYAPIQDSETELNLFVLDDYFIFSSSELATRETIAVDKGMASSLGAYLDQELPSGAIVSDYSSIYMIDFAKLIKSITESKVFGFVKPTVTMASKGEVTGGDIDSIIDILDDISIFVNTYEMSEDGIGRSCVYLGIDGLGQ